jgi:hypothetical protein
VIGDDPVALEEEYVRKELEQTRLYIESMLRPGTEKTTPQAISERLVRAERYARWRFRGFMEGEVASL